MKKKHSKYWRMRKKETIWAGVVFVLTLLIVLFSEYTLLADYRFSSNAFLIGYGVLSIVCLVFNFRRLVITTFGCTAIIALFLKLNLDANQKFALDNFTEKLTIQLINLDWLNVAPQEQKEIISSLDADVIVFQGYTPEWRQVIQRHVARDLEHRVYFDRIDLYGQCIVSRKGLIGVDTVVLEDIPVIRVGLQLNEKDRIKLLSFTMPPELTNEESNRQKRFVEKLTLAKNNWSPTLLLGNFNLTPWSDRLQFLKYKTKTKSSRINKSQLNLIQENPFDYDPSIHILYDRHLQNIFFDELDYNSKNLGVVGQYQIKK